MTDKPQPDPFAELFFTAGVRADKIKRPGRVGGWRGSPASLAALAAHRPGWRDLPHCGCGQPSIRGAKGCRRHATRVLDREARGSPKARLARTVMKMRRDGLIPEGLERQPIWQTVVRMRRRGAYLAIRLLAAWRALEAGDVEAWPAVLAEIRHLALPRTGRYEKTKVS